MVAGGDHGSAVKGLAIDLEVVGSGSVSCCFSFPSSFLTMCSTLPCLSVESLCAKPLVNVGTASTQVDAFPS